MRRTVAWLSLVLWIIAAGPAAAEMPGGRFILSDHHGQTVTDADFRGRLMLVFFGYAFCPDICPTALSNIGEALDLLGDAAEGVAPLFVSVDPERDTVERLRPYVGAFHPRLIGLTGSRAMIDRLAQAYHVRTEVVRREGAAPDDYVVDHTATVFLMGRDGEFLVKFAYGASAEEMAERIRGFLR